MRELDAVVVAVRSTRPTRVTDVAALIAEQNQQPSLAVTAAAIVSGKKLLVCCCRWIAGAFSSSSSCSAAAASFPDVPACRDERRARKSRKGSPHVMEKKRSRG